MKNYPRILLRFVSNFTLFFVALFIFLPDSAAQTDIRTLEPGQILEREISGGQIHKYQFYLEAKQFARIEVEHKILDLNLSLFDSQGKTIIELGGEKRSYNLWQESVSTITDNNGSKILVEVRAFGKPDAVGSYQIKFAEKRAVNPQDTKRLKAEAHLSAGRKLFIQDASESLGKSIKEFETSLLLWKELNELNWQAITLVNLGWAFSELLQSEKAIESQLKATEIFRQTGDKTGESRSLQGLANIYANLYQFDKAEEYYQKALIIRRAIGDKRGEAGTLNNLGLLYESQSQFDKALDYYSQSLKIRQEVKDLQGEAGSLFGLGTIFTTFGQYAKAKDYFEKALIITKETKDTTLESLSLNALGIIYFHLSDFEKAKNYYERSLSIDKATGDTEGLISAYNNLGSVHYSLSQYQQAIRYFEQAFSLSQKTNILSSQAIALNNLGNVYEDLNEYEKALNYYQQALLIQEKITDLTGVGETLTNLGIIYEGNDQLEKAIDVYQKALSITRQLKNKRVESAALHNLGKVYSGLERFNEATDYYEQALKLRREIKDRVGEASTLNNIGVIYLNQGKVPEALTYYYQSLSVIKTTVNREKEALTLRNLMYVQDLLKKTDLAIFYGKQAVNIYQSIRSDIKELDKELQKSYLTTVEDIYRKLIELLIKENRLSEAEIVLRMLKEDEYFEFIQRDRKTVSSLDERINLNPTEKQAFTQNEKISLETAEIGKEYDELELEKPLASPERLRTIKERQTELDKKLEIAKLKFNDFLTELSKMFDKNNVKPANIGETSQSVVKEWNDPQAVFISTVVGQDKLGLIVTSANFQRGYVLDLSEKKLNQLVRDFLSAIAEGSDARIEAQRIYEVLIKPIEKDLEEAQAKTLVWSLDKFLRYIPVAALYDKDKGYLVQNYANVVLALASRPNLALRPEQKNQWKIFGVGVSQATSEFKPLDYVTEELQVIVRDTSSAKEDGLIEGKRLLNKQFTRENFFRDLGKYRYTHAATHFKFISGTKAAGLNSFLLLGNGEKLTLADIHNSDNIFKGIELLTLSACETGFGSKTADGREIEGLGAIAQRKGARAIMATLWMVNDRSTSDFMTNFYNFYQKDGMTKSEAIRQAQLALLQLPDKRTSRKVDSIVSLDEDFAKPFHWSPFILIGNWW